MGLWQSFCLNTNTRIGCWRNNMRNKTKNEILLFLNLEAFCFGLVLFIGSFVFFLVCLCLFVHFTPLISLGFFLLVLSLWTINNKLHQTRDKNSTHTLTYKPKTATKQN
jgi:signal transduction histidine kinase